MTTRCAWRTKWPGSTAGPWSRTPPGRGTRPSPPGSSRATPPLPRRSRTSWRSGAGRSPPICSSRRGVGSFAGAMLGSFAAPVGNGMPRHLHRGARPGGLPLPQRKGGDYHPGDRGSGQHDGRSVLRRALHRQLAHPSEGGRPPSCPAEMSMPPGACACWAGRSRGTRPSSPESPGR